MTIVSSDVYGKESLVSLHDKLRAFLKSMIDDFGSDPRHIKSVLLVEVFKVCLAEEMDNLGADEVDFEVGTSALINLLAGGMHVFKTMLPDADYEHDEVDGMATAAMASLAADAEGETR